MRRLSLPSQGLSFENMQPQPDGDYGTFRGPEIPLAPEIPLDPEVPLAPEVPFDPAIPLAQEFLVPVMLQQRGLGDFLLPQILPQNHRHEIPPPPPRQSGSSYDSSNGLADICAFFCVDLCYLLLTA